jgi:hypothetical protein
MEPASLLSPLIASSLLLALPLLSDSYGMVLRQCAHFYNTIGSSMIESQKPMMLADALEFDKARAGLVTGVTVGLP